MLKKSFKNKRAVMKISLMIFSLFAIIFIAIYAIGVLAVTHTSSVELTPEWSAPRQNINYSVNITNNAPDAVNMVVIYRNMNYTDFKCKEKIGWELNFSTQVCHYIANDSFHYIKEGKSDTFEFSATSPESGCGLRWKFGILNTAYRWVNIYDTTSVYNKIPITTEETGEDESELINEDELELYERDDALNERDDILTKSSEDEDFEEYNSQN